MWFPRLHFISDTSVNFLFNLCYRNLENLLPNNHIGFFFFIQDLLMSSFQAQDTYQSSLKALGGKQEQTKNP